MTDGGVGSGRWTIQIFYDARDAKDQPIRATSVVHVEAGDLGEAYRQVKKMFAGRADVKFGAALPGHHTRMP